MGQKGLLSNFPNIIDDSALNVRPMGIQARTIPLPRQLSQLFFLCEGRGIRITADHDHVSPADFTVTLSHLVFKKEGVRNLRVWLDDVVWEWDSAGEAWIKHTTWRQEGRVV